MLLDGLNDVHGDGLGDGLGGCVAVWVLSDSACLGYLRIAVRLEVIGR